jgi:AcrR family transcriptional regulator
MDSRAAAAARTRESILEAAEELFTARAFDEVTIADVAGAAGVSQQTVVNHFGSKERLVLIGMQERVGPRIEAQRAKVRPGDLDSVITVVVEDYEVTGLNTLRLLAAAERFETMAEVARYGREFQRAWVRHALGPQLERLEEQAREETARLLAVVLDVRTWAQLRFDDGRGVEETKQDLRRLLGAVLTSAC